MLQILQVSMPLALWMNSSKGVKKMKNHNYPNIEVADIFRQYSHLLGRMPLKHWKAVQAIKNCRTGALGGHLQSCGSCDYKKPAYNSCRNRHCPKCGYTERAVWIERRKEELLPCPYFHVVFTLPSELRAVVKYNQKISYNILIKAASNTVKQVAKNNLSVDVGLIAVLHTWSQTLIDHPHVHCIVPGGGLSANKKKWKTCKENYLLPVKVLAKVFRAKILEAFELAFNNGILNFTGQVEHLNNPGSFKDLLITCSGKGFNVYCKKPFSGPKQVLNYLGQYTHRVAISNYRILKLEDNKVYFKYRDPNNPEKSKVMALSAKEFMRRFLLHILPKGFSRIRHFGILANRFKKMNIDIIRNLVNITQDVTDNHKKTWQDILEKLLGLKIDHCPKCKVGILKAGFLNKTFYNTA